MCPANDVCYNLVYSSNGADVESVMIDGKIIMQNRKMLNIDEKEVIKSNKPLLLLFLLMKHFPNFVVYILIFPIAFFYFVCSKRARTECILYQKNLTQ